MQDLLSQSLQANTPKFSLVREAYENILRLTACLCFVVSNFLAPLPTSLQQPSPHLLCQLQGWLVHPAQS